MPSVADEISKEQMIAEIVTLYTQILADPTHEDEILDRHFRLLHPDATDEDWINMKEGLRYSRIILND